MEPNRLVGVPKGLLSSAICVPTGSNIASSAIGIPMRLTNRRIKPNAPIMILTSGYPSNEN